MPWRPLPRIAFAVAIYPFNPSSPADLPLELGDELYIIEQGGTDGEWCRGYLVAPPSLLAGLTSTKGQTLEARVFSGIFPRNCVEIREVLGDGDGYKALLNADRKSIDRLTLSGWDGEFTPRNSQAYSVSDFQAAGEVSDVVFAKKGKPSQIIIHKNQGSDQASASPRWPTGSIPHTPISMTPRDPGAPKPAAPVPMLKIGDETPTSLTEPLVDEIASCLREWHSTNLHELLLARRYNLLEEMSNIVQELDFARRQLLHNVLTGKEKEALRDETVWKLVKANKMLSGDVIVRDPEQRGRLLTGDDSAIQLAKLQSEMSMLDSRPTPTSDATALHQLLLEINAVSGNVPGQVTVGIQLFSRSDTGSLSPLSETFSLDIPSPDKFINMSQGSRLKTLFTELAATDIGDGSANGRQLYLVAWVRAPETRSTTDTTPVLRPSISRESPTPTKATSNGGVQPSAKGSLRARRSMMWAPKQRGPSFDQPSKPISQSIPRTSSSASSAKESATAQPAPTKEVSAIRTVGVGILEISPILRQEKDAEQVINIWSPRRDGEDGEGLTDGFDKLIRALLPSPTGRYVRADHAARLHVHLRPFASSDAECLIRQNPTILHDVIQTQRIGFSKAPTKPRSDIYVTLSQAVFPTDALLSHPQAGQIPLQVTSGLHNLQLTLEVRDAKGARIEKCVFPSSSNTSNTAWRTTIAQRGTPWNQTIRLKIPTEQIPGSHMVMSVADAPEFPFALAWMPLWDQQAFIRDGRHSLLLHAYDKQTSSIENGKGAYLNLPWSALGKNESAKDEAVTGPLATLHLETHLCSTEYSQDQVILSLLNWRERPVDEVLDTLKRLLFVPEIEIVKQLSGVFDALFGILVENAGSEEYENLIFNNLVTALGIVHDRRYNLGPLVDRYADEQFNFPFVTPCLIRSYLRLLNAATDSTQSRNLRAAFKVGRHLLKFIIKAREQQKAKEEGIGITTVQSTFNRDMHTMFKSFETLMKNSSPALVGSKTLVVQHFHTWLPELSNVLSKDEMIMIALSFMDSCKDVTGMLILYKLVLIQNYTLFEVFASGDERRTLISSCIGWLAPYWGSTSGVSDLYRDQVRLSSSIVAQLLSHSDPQLYGFMPSIVASYCAISTEGVDETEYLSLLFSKAFPFQMKTAKVSQRFDESLVELSALMAAIAKISSPKLPKLKELELALFVAQTLEAHNSILDCEAYPETWFSIHVYNHRATIKSLEHIAVLLIDKLLPAPDDADTFDTKLWESFFTTLLKVISSDVLALETFPEQKRRAVWKIAGDVREQGADLLQSTWEAIGWETTDDERERFNLKKLGGYQVQYVPGLVPPIIGLCLSVHEGLRRVAVQILQTMILSEWDLNQDISIIETEIISSLDALFKSKQMNESVSQKIFIGELLDLFESATISDDLLSNAVRSLVGTVDELLDLLVASQNGASTQSLHALKLMEYMKDMGREDIFIRYVHELADAQAAAGNFTEAGLALQFHADLYEWDLTKPLPGLLKPSFPPQSAFERREALYFSVIQNFENAMAWGPALACYKELAAHYEHTTMDFAKLSRAQSSMARIYDLIAKGNKQFPRYFRVAYKGLGFPPGLRDKEFIFEAAPTERMASFVDRMQREHPTAQIMSTGEIPDYEGQFLQISAVGAYRDVSHPVYQRPKVPSSVREHLLISDPSRFSATSRRHTSSSDVREQFVEKLVFTVSEAFPNILRRSEIISAQEVALSPLQTAIERTWRKTQELQLIGRRAASGEDSTLSNLTEALESLLEVRSSASNCVASYRVFLSDAELARNKLLHEVDEEAEEVQTQHPVDPMETALSVALVDHVLAIKHALSLYQRPAQQATQAELLRRFEDVFEPELGPLVPAPLEYSSTTPTQTARQSPSLSDNRRMPPIQRIVSPEQDPNRANRGNAHTRKRSDRLSVSHRISIINPFKRSHGATNSIFTIQQSDSKGQIVGEQDENIDDDTATIHSRTTSHSRGGRSENRRSFFGGDKTYNHGSSPSVALESQTSLNAHNASRDTTARSQDGRSRAGSQPCGPAATGAATDRAVPASSGGWSTIPSTRDYSRPVTRDSNAVTLTTTNCTAPLSPVLSNNNTGMRDSVLRRFSILKGVGRKGSRMDFKANGALPEE
ncbi:Dedicator of cytokinesis C-terminal [Penicillium italicum]|uniref:Dedicator of cytokinesis C-terminal n=1 Tax=Penicillium italicum TaxID=40296 RepID=A0A0A2KH36_PENIT|nr:Dedicator of cytokinesis C-terminal [Penicillium italicum]